MTFVGATFLNVYYADTILAGGSPFDVIGRPDSFFKSIPDDALDMHKVLPSLTPAPKPPVAMMKSTRVFAATAEATTTAKSTQEGEQSQNGNTNGNQGNEEGNTNTEAEKAKVCKK
jgi:hypothetical protein